MYICKVKGGKTGCRKTGFGAKTTPDVGLLLTQKRLFWHKNVIGNGISNGIAIVPDVNKRRNQNSCTNGFQCRTVCTLYRFLPRLHVHTMSVSYAILWGSRNLDGIMWTVNFWLLRAGRFVCITERWSCFCSGWFWREIGSVQFGQWILIPNYLHV